MSGSSSTRLAAGFLLAACTPGFVCASVVFLSQPARSGSLNFLGGVLVWVMWSSFVTIPAAFLPGVAAYQFYRCRGWKSWWSYALGGALICWACVAVPRILMSPPALFAWNFWQLSGPAAVLGSLSALTLWFSIYARARFLLAALGLACAGLLLNELLVRLAA